MSPFASSQHIRQRLANFRHYRQCLHFWTYLHRFDSCWEYSYFFLSISLCHLLENHLCHHCFCLSGENAIQDQDVLSAALYPKVFKDYMLFKEEFGPVHGLPTRLFFTGPDIGEEFQVELQPGKVLNIKVLAISDLHPNGQREVFCEMNGQLRTVMVEDKSVTKVLTRVLTILRKTS